MTGALIDQTSFVAAEQMIDLAGQTSCSVIKATVRSHNTDYFRIAGWIRGMEGVVDIIYVGRAGLRHVIGIVLDGNTSATIISDLARIKDLTFDSKVSLL
jgi:hypothetical protein